MNRRRLLQDHGSLRKTPLDSFPLSHIPSLHHHKNMRRRISNMAYRSLLDLLKLHPI